MTTIHYIRKGKGEGEEGSSLYLLSCETCTCDVIPILSDERIEIMLLSKFIKILPDGSGVPVAT